MAWIVSHLNEQVDVAAFFVVCRSSPAFSAAPIPKRPRRTCAPQLHRINRFIVVPNGPRLGTCQLSDGSVWQGGSGQRIRLRARSPTVVTRYCEAFAGRVRR